MQTPTASMRVESSIMLGMATRLLARLWLQGHQGALRGRPANKIHPSINCTTPDAFDELSASH